MKGKLVCWRCGEPLLKVEQPFPRLAKCQHCAADLHVCRMCRYYNPKLSDRCDHELAEPAREVDLANFCHYLKLKPDAYLSDEYDKTKQAAEKLRSLFGGQAEDSIPRPVDKDGLDPLKALFNDETDADKPPQD